MRGAGEERLSPGLIYFIGAGHGLHRFDLSVN